MRLIAVLPVANAVLNGFAACLLAAGFFAIRGHRVRLHRALMISAFGCSVLFLTGYLTFHALAGVVRFTATGVAARRAYFTLLISHTLLAATVPVLAIIVLTLALRRRFRRHRRLARWTLPIWLYVSITGVVIYWILFPAGLGSQPRSGGSRSSLVSSLSAPATEASSSPFERGR